jgi:type IV pilus assembly protein PilE
LASGDANGVDAGALQRTHETHAPGLQAIRHRLFAADRANPTACQQPVSFAHCSLYNNSVRGKHMKNCKHAGFTLIELMIAIAVAAILAAVAVPAYTGYVTRSKIPEATGTLSSLRVKMEQWYQDNRKYSNGDDSGCGVGVPSGAAAKYFTYSCALATGTNQAYTLTATGNASQGMGDFTYTIDNSGTQKTESLPGGWGSYPVNCWVTKKGGSC